MVWALIETHLFIWPRERFMTQKEIWPHYLKCSLFCKRRKCLHLQRSLHHIRFVYLLCFFFGESSYSLSSLIRFRFFLLPQNYSSRMAAIDYTVCLHSEVFVTTQGGNFPHFLMGHRRYLYGGHAKTIRPDKRKLAQIFDNPNIG